MDAPSSPIKSILTHLSFHRDGVKTVTVLLAVLSISLFAVTPATAASAVWDDFNDCDVTDWSHDQGGSAAWKAVSESKEGACGAIADPSEISAAGSADKSFTDAAQNNVTVYWNTTSWQDVDFRFLQFEDSGGSRIVGLEPNGTGEMAIEHSGEVVLNGLPTGEWVEVELILDTANNEVDVKAYDESGTLIDESLDVSTEQSYSELQGVKVRYDDTGPADRFDYFAVDGEKAPLPADKTLSGYVFDENEDPINNSTVRAEKNGSFYDNATTNEEGFYTISIANGTYNLTAYKDGYVNDTGQITVAGSDVEQNFTLFNESEALELESRLYLEHGKEAPYTVWYRTKDPTTGKIVRQNVSVNATVTSNDTNVVTVNQSRLMTIATSDTSVNNQTFLTATFTNDDGETLTTTRNITVANKTVTHLKILPPVTRFSAVLSEGTDSNPDHRTGVVLIVATGVGVAASIVATSLAGVSALALMMMMAWFGGFTSAGMAMVATLGALFIGMNVAGNVDYTARKD